MITEKTGATINKEQLAALYQEMQENNDLENAEKILHLHEKLVNEELIVSFSGHFSAGKSSMINNLLGEDILPKSPIPTSANIVKMTSGEGWARVFFRDQPPVEYKEPYDLDMIKAYSTDRDSIKRLDINTAKEIIPKGTAVIDTPGIDAADDADRLMTEGALYLVDVLFYVMDYNHVQSEVNLYFLKSLQENSIPFYLIINQIDKHNEDEIPFIQYVDRIKQTFAGWNLRPKNIFFTSLYDFSLEINDFELVKDTIFTMLRGDKNAYFNIDASVNQVIHDHKEFLKRQYDDLFDEANGVEDNSNADLDEIIDLEAKIKALQEKPDVFEKEFLAELDQTLKNAYLMPKEMRDQALSYLESEQPGFKVGGFFGAKKKTEEEKQLRLATFHKNLLETMESNIQWKLRDKFIKISKDYGLNEATLQEKLNAFSIVYDEANLRKLMNPNAKINGDYVLNYTNDVANDVKNQFKQAARLILKEMKQMMTEQTAAEIATYEKEYAGMEDAQVLKDKYEHFQTELKMKQNQLDDVLVTPKVDEEKWQELVKVYRQSQEEITVEESPVALPETEIEAEVETKAVTNSENKSQDTPEKIQEHIDYTLGKIADLPGFQDLQNDLLHKKERLANRTFTIALFGAFSAGKSSFSNALIGNRALPVSPNPTTATVNRIRPVSEEHPHGTVNVTMKSDDILYEEIYEITEKFAPKARNFTDLLDWIRAKHIHQEHSLNKMYQAYLRALVSGYEENKGHLGKQVTVSLDDFAEYVADETKSCYVESIDLYYDSPITQQGITLVDTPGADSVNARHTSVAFDYIKHADAILYVTYYNHALSRADRDFLMQLGRVKEAFELDKMFFIVNASDLAESEDELQMVLKYVDDELLKLGIRNARLFPVSSKQSLEEKLADQPLNDKMSHFEEEFHTFIHHDLAQLMIESAVWDMQRVQHTMEHLMNSVNLSPTEKEKQKQGYMTDRKELASEINQWETAVYDEQISQRIEKQLHYVGERLTIRFHDMFKETFNPTVINENGRKAKVQLERAMEQLLEYVQFELHQELQAVSIRIEGYGKELSTELYQAFSAKSVEKNDLFELPNVFEEKLTTPAYEEKFANATIADFQSALNMFKGTKAFFVNNEKEAMKDKLSDLFEPFVQAFLKQNEEIMTNSYVSEWQTIVENMKTSVNNHVEQHVDNYFAMLEATDDLPALNEDVRTLKEIVGQYEGEV